MVSFWFLNVSLLDQSGHYIIFFSVLNQVDHLVSKSIKALTLHTRDTPRHQIENLKYQIETKNLDVLRFMLSLT